MGRRDGVSLDGAFCGSCGMYNGRGGKCRVCGAPLQEPAESDAGTWGSDEGVASDTSAAPEPLVDSATAGAVGDDEPSESADCPECGFPRTSSQSSCPRCGYASPRQMWRKGGDVIARKGAAFTHACVVCGATDDLETVTGRTFRGIEQGDGGAVLDLGKLIEMVKGGFASAAYDLRLALCPRHLNRRKRIESSNTWVSAAAVGSIMKTGVGSADYHRFRGMNRGFRETLPEWEGPFPPPERDRARE